MRLTIRFANDESLTDDACRRNFMALHEAFSADGLNLRSSNSVQDLTPEVRSYLLTGMPQAMALSAFAVDVIKPLGAGLVVVLGQWLAGRNGHKIRIEVGDKKIEASNVAEVEKLVTILKELGDK